MSDELPRQLQSLISTFGLSCPLAVASVGDAGLSLMPLSLRTTQSFRVLNSRQCVYEVVDGDDQEILANLRADGRISLLFEVCAPTSQQVRIQGRGLVYDRGSSAYNAIAPRSSTWYPSALVCIAVQRVWISNAGPLIAVSPPLLAHHQTLNSTSASASGTMSRSSRLPREASDVGAVSTRRSNSGLHPVESWGWPVGGDACCVT